MDTRDKISYLNFLSNIETSSENQILINKFIEAVIRLSVNCIKQLRRKESKYIFPAEESIENIAVDAVAPLFTRDENGQFYVLKNSFNSWNPPVSSEQEAVFFLNKIVAKRVSQHIAQYLRETDPLFSKILDNINYKISQGNFTKAAHLGTVYIQRENDEEISGGLIESYVLESFPGSLFNLSDKTLLDNLFRYIDEKTDFFPAVPLNALIYRIKGFYGRDFQVNDSFDIVKNIETDELLNHILDDISRKLNTSYVLNGKLNRDEGKAIMDTINELVNDLKYGSNRTGLYDYLKMHIDGLDRDQYKQNYQNILEYLVKLIKEKIVHQL